jgi:hypothetical protein
MPALVLAASAAAALAPSAAPSARAPLLPARVTLVVLHVLGGPSYGAPERRFAFFPPPRTFALWKERFGAHWIVWTDGSLWPRHAGAGEAVARRPDVRRPPDLDEQRRLVREATPVYAHLRGVNRRSVGLELAHSGRSRDPFPEAQVQTLVWLLHALLELSGGRLGPSDIAGHKDLDRRPAYVSGRCERPGCPVFVDAEGRPYRRRVDPPETLFAELARQGLTIPRPADGDRELLRAERLGAGERPTEVRSAGP